MSTTGIAIPVHERAIGGDDHGHAGAPVEETLGRVADHLPQTSDVDAAIMRVAREQFLGQLASHQLPFQNRQTFR
jgi:hypothetical protein